MRAELEPRLLDHVVEREARGTNQRLPAFEHFLVLLHFAFHIYIINLIVKLKKSLTVILSDNLRICSLVLLQLPVLLYYVLVVLLLRHLHLSPGRPLLL